MSLNAALLAAAEELGEAVENAKDSRAAWHEVNLRLGMHEQEWHAFRGEVRTFMDTMEKRNAKFQDDVLGLLRGMATQLGMNGTGGVRG